MAISEYFAWTDQRLIALLLISRGIDDLDGKSDTEIFTEESGNAGDVWGDVRYWFIF